MKIIVLNSGSSSIKYQFFNTKTKEVYAKGVVEKVGMLGSFIKHENSKGDKTTFEGEIIDHQAAIENVLAILISKKHGVIKDFNEIDAVGHRIVHGGEKFQESILLTNDILTKMQVVTELAPLHNPANLKGIYAMREILPKVPQVGVFDTAFHQTMPAKAYMYAIPYSLYTKYGVRRYGFHGTSHRYVSERACEVLCKDFKKSKIITCHLGNGASITAIKNGKSVDTSMGLTPVEGLIMGTRTGDLGLGALLFIMEKEEIDAISANALINKHSGILGISGISSDMRDVEEAAFKDKNKRAKLALEMYHYRIKKYIGAYAAAMGGLDIIVFTGGIGENGAESREEICKGLEFLGLNFDKKVNAGKRGKEVVISKPNSKVTAIVVPTNEELVIAMDTMKVVEKKK